MWIAIYNRVVRVSLMENVALEQRHEGGEGVSHVINCGKSVSGRRNSD